MELQITVFLVHKAFYREQCTEKGLVSTVNSDNSLTKPDSMNHCSWILILVFYFWSGLVIICH